MSPLRERPEDISYLAMHLLEGINRKLKGNVKSIDAEAVEALIHYDWRGNVRELINVLEQAVLNAGQNEKVDVESLPEFVRREETHRDKVVRGIRGVVVKAERTAILDTLQLAKGNIRKAAALLGISRAALYKKLQKYHIDK